MSILSLKYGNGVVTLNTKNPLSLEKTVLPSSTPLKDLGQTFVNAASYQCIHSPGLNTLAKPKDLYTIVLRGHAQVRMDYIVSMLTYYLSSLGVPYENMTVLCPGGSKGCIPADLASRLTVSVPDASATDFISYGRTSQNIEVLAHPLLKGRKIILVDCVHRDPFTGYTGGGASLLGAYSSKTAEACYAKAYTAPGQVSPSVQSGIMTGNPLCQAVTDAAALLQPFFGIYAVTDSAGQFLNFVCGNWLEAWHESCKIAQQQFALPLSGKADIVVASCGGNAYDSTLLCAYPSLCHAVQALNAPTGTIILAAECREGDPQGLLDSTAAPNSQEGIAAYGLRFFSKKFRIMMQSKINTQALGILGIEAFRTMETLEAKVDFAGKTVRFLPCANETAPYQA